MKKSDKSGSINFCSYENSENSILQDKHRESSGPSKPFKTDHKLSILTCGFGGSQKTSLQQEFPLKQMSKTDAQSIEHGISLTNTEKEILPPSSPLKKMMGLLGKGFGTFSKGIGSKIGNIRKGIGSGVESLGKGLGSGIGSIGKGIGNGIGTLGKGLGLNALGKNLGNLSAALRSSQFGKGLNIVSKGLRLNSLGKGLGAISKHGLRGLNNLSKGLGLDLLGKGLNDLSRLGLDQLGRGLKDIGKGLSLRRLQENLKKIAFGK